MMKFGEIRKPLLIFCLSASLAVHAGAIWFLFVHPYSLDIEETQALKPSPTVTIVPKENEELIVEKIEKALEESLNTVTLASQQKRENNDIASQSDSSENKIKLKEGTQKQTLFVTKPKIREEEMALFQNAPKDFAASMPPPFDPEMGASLKDFALEDDLEETFSCYQDENYASIDFNDPHVYQETRSMAEAIEDDYTMTDQQFYPSALPTHSGDNLDPHFIASLKKLHINQMEQYLDDGEEKMFNQLSESTTPKLVLPNSVDYLRNLWIKRSLAERSLPHWEYYGLEEIATQLEWEEECDIDVALMPAPEENKYIFSLTLHPDFTAEAQPMQQNFYFLVDRSSSVEKNKFNRFKRAVQRSLAALHEGDRFNIYIFDKNVTKLSERILPVSPKTIQMAEEFLEEQNAKTHFAATEVYTTIDKILPEKFDSEQLHSVILITDGKTLLTSQKQKEALSSWSKKYEGILNFYAAASGKGNNLVLLDLLSYCTGGKMLYSDTNSGFPRKLVRLVKDLHNPIVKNVSIEVTPEDSNARVTLYPTNKYLPPLFANQPYTITGTVDELCDLTVYMQGRNHGKWLNIRKKLPLDKAGKGGRSLEKIWAETQAKICYDHFLKNGKSTHLKEAVQIMTPYHGTIAEEQ